MLTKRDDNLLTYRNYHIIYKLAALSLQIGNDSGILKNKVEMKGEGGTVISGLRSQVQALASHSQRIFFD